MANTKCQSKLRELLRIKDSDPEINHSLYGVPVVGKHSHYTDKELQFELDYLKRRIAESRREAKRLLQEAKQLGDEARKRAKEANHKS